MAQGDPEVSVTDGTLLAYTVEAGAPPEEGPQQAPSTPEDTPDDARFMGFGLNGGAGLSYCRITPTRGSQSTSP
jgi:hypothetical protein